MSKPVPDGRSCRCYSKRK